MSQSDLFFLIVWLIFVLHLWLQWDTFHSLQAHPATLLSACWPAHKSDKSVDKSKMAVGKTLQWARDGWDEGFDCPRTPQLGGTSDVELRWRVLHKSSSARFTLTVVEQGSFILCQHFKVMKCRTFYLMCHFNLCQDLNMVNWLPWLFYGIVLWIVCRQYTKEFSYKLFFLKML